MNQDPETGSIISAAIDVQWHLGTGFLEAVYQDALSVELFKRGIPFQKEVTIPIFYKGEQLKSFYKADFVCYGSIIVELKALPKLSGTEDAQILNYLKATRMKRALLLNFGVLPLGKKRYVL